MTRRFEFGLIVAVLLFVAGIVLASSEARAQDADKDKPPASSVLPSESGANAEAAKEQPKAEANAKDDKDSSDLARELFIALTSGKWLPAVGAALMLLIAGIRKFGTKILPWLGTRKGGYALAFTTAMLTAVGVSMSAGEFSWAVVVNAVGLGFAAIGVHQALKDAKTTSTS